MAFFPRIVFNFNELRVVCVCRVCASWKRFTFAFVVFGIISSRIRRRQNDDAECGVTIFLFVNTSAWRREALADCSKSRHWMLNVVDIFFPVFMRVGHTHTAHTPHQPLWCKQYIYRCQLHHRPSSLAAAVTRAFCFNFGIDDLLPEPFGRAIHQGANSSEMASNTIHFFSVAVLIHLTRNSELSAHKRGFFLSDFWWISLCRWLACWD